MQTKRELKFVGPVRAKPTVSLAAAVIPSAAAANLRGLRSRNCRLA